MPFLRSCVIETSIAFTTYNTHGAKQFRVEGTMVIRRNTVNSYN